MQSLEYQSEMAQTLNKLEKLNKIVRVLRSVTRIETILRIAATIWKPLLLASEALKAGISGIKQTIRVAQNALFAQNIINTRLTSLNLIKQLRSLRDKTSDSTQLLYSFPRLQVRKQLESEDPAEYVPIENFEARQKTTVRFVQLPQQAISHYLYSIHHFVDLRNATKLTGACSSSLKKERDQLWYPILVAAKY